MAMNERQVQISIESLSLVGFSGREAARFEVAFRNELTSLVTGAPESRFASGDQEKLAGSVSIGAMIFSLLKKQGG